MRLLGAVLAGGLHHALAIGPDAVGKQACGILILPQGLRRRLIAALRASRVEPPAPGVLPAALRAKCQGFSNGEDRSMRRWACACGALGIEAGAPAFSMNHRGDLAAAAPGVDP